MSRELCDNCGHPMPNAVGGGVYCNNCGEPAQRPRRQTGVTTYDLTIKGEQHTFSFPVWRGITLDQLSRIVGDLTGYRSTFVRECVADGMRRSRLKVVELGGSERRKDLDFGVMPLRFLIAESGRG
jgi:hypothetical protein